MLLREPTFYSRVATECTELESKDTAVVAVAREPRVQGWA